MSYNRVRTPKFYIDAVLLARKLGHIKTENADGKYYLNPTKTTSLEIPSNGQKHISIYMHRYFLNSLTHCFILGHQLSTDGLTANGYIRIDPPAPAFDKHTIFEQQELSTNGWSFFQGNAGTNLDAERFTLELRGDGDSFTPIGDISVGWSYEMPHTPDLELTQTFANESLKVQTTKGGHTLTNTGWTQPPKWGNYSQWKRSSQVTYPARRSWNLKFSYLADENSDNSGLMPQYYNEHDVNNNNRGIFERTSVTIDDVGTPDDDTDDTVTQSFNIKNDFLSKVMPTINLGLPFIFQPNKDVQEYAICRVNANSVALNQVAHQVYDVSLDIVEIW